MLVVAVDVAVSELLVGLNVQMVASCRARIRLPSVRQYYFRRTPESSPAFDASERFPSLCVDR